MCGGFNCSKNSLILINILFLLVSLVLIGVASYAKAASVIDAFEVVGGIVASGFFLFLIAILGLVAASKHHQVLLFFYIVVLFLLFIIQISVSIACLAITKTLVQTGLGNLWEHDNTTAPVQVSTVEDFQKYFQCCGWSEVPTNTTDRPCMGVKTCENLSDETCQPCEDMISKNIYNALEASGGIGLFFSFAEMLGVWLAVRFRNQKDPKANPSQFL